MAGLQIARCNLERGDDVSTFTINNDIIFDPKADAVPFNYRISYKVSLICLIMNKCCGKKGCSAIKMQMVSFATVSTKGQEELLKALENDSKSNIVRFDPAINRAINYALYDDIIYRQGNGLYRLTARGKAMSTKIYADKLLMRSEKEFLNILTTKLTEEYIDGLSKKWGDYHVEG